VVPSRRDSVPPALTRPKVRQAVTAAGSQFLAAPVSGNPHMVADGAAVLVTSGPRETYDLVRPYLEAISGRPDPRC
jgi:3-hydroxyisobutyrate dehydrogenase-like beta-hydroxyacid dehydrogenase